MTLSFPIDDLRKSVPEATGLDGLSGHVLIDALRKVLGKLADGAVITVTDGMVTLDFGEKQFRLTVRDDGAGFDPAKPPPTSGGFGLVGMKERAAELKGELCIRSEPDKGTEITLTVPLSGE